MINMGQMILWNHGMDEQDDDPHGPDDPFRTINYHHLDISGHDGMDEHDIGWRNGWAGEDFGLEVGQM
jgi:hypothetical protein